MIKTMLLLAITILAACGGSTPEPDRRYRVGDDAGVIQHEPDSGVLPDVGEPDRGETLLQNGEQCATGSECVSGDCGEAGSGQRYCYGHQRVGESCTITQDCFSGVCSAGQCVNTRSDFEKCSDVMVVFFVCYDALADCSVVKGQDNQDLCVDIQAGEITEASFQQQNCWTESTAQWAAYVHDRCIGFDPTTCEFTECLKY